MSQTPRYEEWLVYSTPTATFHAILKKHLRQARSQPDYAYYGANKTRDEIVGKDRADRRADYYIQVTGMHHGRIGSPDISMMGDMDFVVDEAYWSGLIGTEGIGEELT